MELFQKGVDKGSPEAHLYIGMGYLCMYNVHVIYTHIQERERERREGWREGEGVHIHTYTCIYSLFSLQDGLGKQINPMRGISSLQIASSQGGVACINVN